jgi:PilZ domain
MSNGRSEKRIARTVSVELRLPDSPVLKERTSTENVSAHGARLFMKQRLKPGQAIVLVSPTEGVGCEGQIVYCERISENRFAVGLELRGSVEAWARAY